MPVHVSALRPWLQAGLQIAVGLVFVYSGAAKIFDLPGLADSLRNYRLLPEALIPALAIWLPWLELFAGLAVLTGYLRRGGALLLCALLGGFTLAVALSMARGIDITCGCSLPLSLSTRIGFGKFIENVLWLGATACIFLFSRQGNRARGENGEA